MSQPSTSRANPAPDRAKSHLPRPRLLARLRAALEHQVTLVCAPAGAGKTTLLRDFAEATDAATVWCQIDRSHRDPAVLAGDLLRELGVPADPIEARDYPPAAWSVQAVLPRLSHALSDTARARGGQLVLLVDDYHKVDSSAAANEMMAALIDSITPQVHVVISSRSVPKLPLARLRLNRELLEITRDDLVLDAEEVSKFVSAWDGPKLSEEEEKLVLEKTGGWIAGISMLTHSLRSRGKGELIAFLREFSGGFGLVYDYFAEEVLQQQTPSVQQFLMATSLLDELHRDLVNPLLEITDAQSILESLAASNLFIVCLDENHDWYRYHPLFREFLRVRAQRNLGRPTLTRLHRRAAGLHASQGSWSRAIHHLCAAGSYEEAAAIIEREGEACLERGYLETLHQWLVALPERLRRERPSLLMLEGVVAQRQGRYQEAMHALTQAQTFFAEVGDTGRLAAVTSERAMVSYRMRNYREAVDLLEFTLAMAADPFRRAQTLARLCRSHRQLGELERAVRFGDAALRALETSGSEPHPGLENRTLRYLAEAHTLRGDLDRALAFLLRANELCGRESFGDLEQAYVMCGLGMIRAIRGETALALQALQDAEAHGATYVEPQRRAVNLWRGNLLVDLGDFDGAEKCYQLAGFPAAERAWLHLRQRQPGRAILIAREALDESVESEPLHRATLTAVLALALAASGQEPGALKLLREADALFEHHGYVHHLASLRLHTARILISANQVGPATSMLRDTLRTAESRGFYHFYWWDPESLAWLLSRAPALEQHRRYIRMLVERHPAEGDRSALAPLNSTHPESSLHDLTPRGERDSLGLIAQLLACCNDAPARIRIERAIAADPRAAGCILRLRSHFGFTWREIEVFVAYYLDRRFCDFEGRGPLRRELAGDLCMTENTLKSHVKRIRRKLDLPVGADSLLVYRRVVDPTGQDAR